MLDFLKWIGYILVAILGVSLALGIGAVLTVLGSLLSMILLGGGVILIIILMVRELFGIDK